MTMIFLLPGATFTLLLLCLHRRKRRAHERQAQALRQAVARIEAEAAMRSQPHHVAA